MQNNVIEFVSDLRQVWFFPGILFSSTDKTYRHDITEILLKLALNPINQPTNQYWQDTPICVRDQMTMGLLSILLSY